MGKLVNRRPDDHTWESQATEDLMVYDEEKHLTRNNMI